MADLNKVLAANPYKNQARNYFQSPWQTWLAGLGFRTESDAWRENMGVQSAEYDAQMALMQYQNEYNSPSAQAARMREAGLNPDLQGIGDVAQAAMPGDDPSTPMQSTGAEGTASELANFCMNAFTTALGITQGLQGMAGVHLDNVMKKVSIDKGISDFAKEMWPYMLPESPDPSAGDGLDLYANPTSWKAAALSNAQKFAGRIRPRYRKQMIETMQQYWESGPGQAESYDAWKKRVQERRGYYSERGTFYSDVDDVLQDIVDPLVQMSQKIFSQNQSTQLAEGQAAQNVAEYQEKLYDDNGLDPRAESAARNSQNALTDTNASAVNTLNESVNDIIQNLQRTAKNESGLKGALANVALVLMASVRLWLANVGMPSISSSSSQSSGTGYGNGHFVNQAHSSGFSLGF